MMGLQSAVRYCIRRETPVRELANRAVAELAPRLSGRVIEIGGFGDGRRSLATNAQEYLVTNLDPSAEMVLNATDMHLSNESVDGILCESVLEHVDAPERLLKEAYRVLRPSGRILLVAPWLYPFHSAPDDFYRFSQQALAGMLDQFSILELRPLGNFWTTMATFAQLKVSPWRSLSKFERASRIVAGAPLLAWGFGFYGLSKVFRENDDFAPLHCALAEKR